MLGDAFDRALPAFGLADHRQQAEFEHHVGELVHPGRGGRAGGADRLAHDRVDRTDIVDRPAAEIDRQLLALVEHVLDALVGGVAPGQHGAGQQQAVARLPALHFLGRQIVEVHAPGGGIGLPVDVGPLRKIGRIDEARARAVEREMGMASGGTIGDHRHRLARRMAGRIEDLDVQHGGKPAQPLRADAHRIDAVEDLDPELLDVVLRPARLELAHVDRIHQRQLGELHAVLGRAADTDAEHARRAPAGAHAGNLLHHPFDDIVRRVHHLEARLVLAPAALGGNVDADGPPRDHVDREDAGRIVAGVAAREGRIGEDRGAQRIVGVGIGAADAFIDHVLQRTRGFQPAFLPPPDEDVDDAGILADRPVPFGAHTAVGEDLRDRVFRGRPLLRLIGAPERLDIVQRVVMGDILERVGDALDQVFLANRYHVAHRPCTPSCRMTAPLCAQGHMVKALGLKCRSA